MTTKGLSKIKKRTGNSEITYREIFEKASDGIFILDITTGEILNTNQRASAITGYSMEELLNAHPALISSLNPGFTKKDADKKIWLAATKGNQIFEWEVKRKDHSIHWVEVSCTIANIGGYERVIGFFHEINDRKKIETLLQKSEANLRSMFNHTEVAFMLLDNSFTILSFNETADRWAELWVGVRMVEGANLISLISKDRQKEFADVMNKILAGNAIDHEIYYQLKDGSVEWYRVRNNPVRDINGTVIGICLSAANITVRKFSEMENEKLTKDLIQRNKDLEQFAYIVSHNLRAPVANIIGLTEVLYNMEIEQAEEKQMTCDLITTVKQLDNVIKDLNQILQLQRTENVKKEKVSFTELVADIQVSIDTIIRKEEVNFICDFIQADTILTLKSYMHSIFFNLISNSIKYRQMHISPVIKITSVRRGNKVQLIFKDNGLGIDLEKKGEQVFGLYKRFHSHAEGKGMGLFMVKTQVETLGGKITIKSEINKGTEFIIEFENESNK
jgi:PAS domain S-box-containing protein